MAAKAPGARIAPEHLAAHRFVWGPEVMDAGGGEWGARLKDVSQRYGKAIALDGVSLDVPSNKMIGLIGPDGVGKSTLLGMISGVRKIQIGRVALLCWNST